MLGRVVGAVSNPKIDYLLCGGVTLKDKLILLHIERMHSRDVNPETRIGAGHMRRLLFASSKSLRGALTDVDMNDQR